MWDRRGRGESLPGKVGNVGPTGALREKAGPSAPSARRSHIPPAKKSGMWDRRCHKIGWTVGLAGKYVGPSMPAERGKRSALCGSDGPAYQYVGPSLPWRSALCGSDGTTYRDVGPARPRNVYVGPARPRSAALLSGHHRRSHIVRLLRARTGNVGPSPSKKGGTAGLAPKYVGPTLRAQECGTGDPAQECGTVTCGSDGPTFRSAATVPPFWAARRPPARRSHVSRSRGLKVAVMWDRRGQETCMWDRRVCRRDGPTLRPTMRDRRTDKICGTVDECRTDDL